MHIMHQRGRDRVWGAGEALAFRNKLSLGGTGVGRIGVVLVVLLCTKGKLKFFQNIAHFHLNVTSCRT